MRLIKTILRNSTTTIFLITASIFMQAAPGDAAEPGWTNRVLKLGQDRQSTNSKPIVERPYRPLHFYGNTVRRRHYRGYAAPRPRDVVQTARAVFAR